MSREEVKTEIEELLIKTPEEGLLEVLSYLKTLQGKTTDQIATSKHLKNIIKEDSELLTRLAK
jgi:hypothetical protein